MTTKINQIPKTGERIVALSDERVTINEESRSIEISFSSDAPVDMNGWDGIYREVLDHSEGAVRLSRLNSKAPLLFNHDRNQLIGVVESARTADGRGYATVRFSKSEEGQKRFNEVQDGILANVSVGYVRNRVVSEGERDGVESVRVTDWEPLEVSLVTVPADTSVGVGRTAQKGDDESVTVERASTQTTTEKVIMSEEIKTPAPKVNVDEVAASAQKAERKRVSDIDQLARTLEGKNINIREEADKAKAEGLTLDGFRALALEKIPGVKKAEALELPKGELRRYSLARAVECARTGKYDGLEGEIHNELLKRSRRVPTDVGIIVPSDLFGVRSITAGTAAAGAELVSEETMGLIEKLDNKPVVEMAGARRLNGLNGDVVLPKQSGGATAYWVSETESVTASDITTGSVRMTPKRLGVLSKFSNQLSAQSSIGVEALLRSDIGKRIAIACDLAAFQGTGTDGEPKGLFNYNTSTSGINTVTYGAAATFAKVNEAISTILADNADVGAVSGIIDPTSWAKWASKSVDAGSGRFLWNGGLADGTVGPGVKGHISNHLPSNKSVFGVFSEMILGFWEGVNLIVDPYTSKASGLVELYAEVLMDIAVRHPESFCVSTDSAAQ